MSHLRYTFNKYLAVITLLVGLSFGYLVAQRNSTQVYISSETPSVLTQPIGCPMGQNGTCP